MIPFSSGDLIRCDCGHAVAQHSDSGCGAGAPCRCVKTPSGIMLEEIAALRPEWLAPKPSARP
jgi:hypothetical protein